MHIVMMAMTLNISFSKGHREELMSAGIPSIPCEDVYDLSFPLEIICLSTVMTPVKTTFRGVFKHERERQLEESKKK